MLYQNVFEIQMNPLLLQTIAKLVINIVRFHSKRLKLGLLF
jgi:hypothetical protein